MRHDDRLDTVLRLPVSAPAMARIQWRQLIDLIGTAPAEARSETIDAAFVRLRALAGVIPAAARARILGEPGVRLRSPRLVAELARGEPAVAAAALAAARLDDEAWADLVPALPAAARAMLHGRDDLGPGVAGTLARLGVTARGLPGAEVAAAAGGVLAAPSPGADGDKAGVAPIGGVPEEAASDLAAPAEAPPVGEGIGAVWRRIEAFRRARAEPAAAAVVAGDSPQLPLGDVAAVVRPPLAAFDFLTDVAGRVVWSLAETAPMVVGLNLAAMTGEDGSRPGDAIRLQQPMRGMVVNLSGAAAITGRWQIDAVARFDAAAGRYAGHAGRFRRLPDVAPAAGGGEADRLRQMLHELRTPVNAIQGFAEIIQQQLFGPTPHEYRAFAAAIAGDAARMLAGFEELERYARLETGAEAVAAGAGDLAVALGAAVAAMAPHLAAGGGGFARVTGCPRAPVPVAEVELERLCWRVLGTLAGHCAAGERLAVAVDESARGARAVVPLPAALAGVDAAALFRAAAPVASAGGGPGPHAGMFGSGFALRLAATEAAAAGGTLALAEGALVLTLPAGLTHDAAPHSEADTHAMAVTPAA